MCTKAVGKLETTSPRKSLDFTSRVGQELLKRMEEILTTHGESSAAQIGPLLNRGPDRTRVILLDMQQAGYLHIWDWAPDKDGRMVIPIYTWGPGEDAPRPPPKFPNKSRSTTSKGK